MDLTKRKSQKNQELNLDLYGKVPPQAIELEAAVLGVILLEGNNAHSLVADILRAECFYSIPHQLIFRAMGRLAAKSMPIDTLTVLEELKDAEDLDKAGGAYAVSKLTDKVVSRVEEHARIVYQKWLCRMVITNSIELINIAFAEKMDAFDLVDQMLTMHDAVTQKYVRKEVSFEALVAKTAKNILEHKPDIIKGRRSYFKGLDRIIDYFINGLFYVIAARPAMGKTAFMVQLLENLTKQRMLSDETLIKEKPVGIIELETHDEGFIQRLLGNLTGINTRAFKHGGLTTDEMRLVSEGASDLLNRSIVCDFDPVSTISQIRIKAKRWKALHDIGILLVDYLQYIEPDDADQRAPRERQVGKISRGLAVLAKELQIPVIAFAQLSREVYKRADKRPQMSDLRESGNIEQDARVVMFLHRPEYYGEVEDKETGRSLLGVTEVIVAKNNEGDTGKQLLYFQKHLSKFTEIEEEEENELYRPVPPPSVGGDGGFDNGYDEVAPF